MVGLGKKKFFGCGFHVIVGGGGVGLIPCDLGCINGVDSSLLFLEFCVDFGDFFFFFVVLGGGGGLYLWVVVVGLLQFCACVCVWWWVFILYFFYINSFFLIFLYIIVMYRIEK